MEDAIGVDRVDDICVEILDPLEGKVVILYLASILREELLRKLDIIGAIVVVVMLKA